MVNGTPDFIPDNQMPDFIPDNQAGQYFGDTSNSVTDYGPNNMLSGVHSVAQGINKIPGGSFVNDILGSIYEAPRAVGAAFGNNKGYGYSDKATGQFHNIENPFFDTQDVAKIQNPNGFATRAIKDTAGAATYAIPALAPFKGAGILPAIGNSMATGAVRGLPYGISQQGDTLDKFDPSSIGAYSAGTALAQPVLDVGALGLKGLTSGMLSKGGVWKKMVSAVEGKTVNWDTVASKARDVVANKSALVKKELESLLAEVTPAPETGILKNSVGPSVDAAPMDNGFTGAPETPSVPGKPVTAEQMIKDTPLQPEGGGPRGNPKINIPSQADLAHTPQDYLPSQPDVPSSYGKFGEGINPGPDISGSTSKAIQGLNTRVDLGERLPKNFFDNLFRQVPNEKQEAIKVLRQSLSDHLKEVAPDIKTPDALYHLYSKMGGDIPTWGKRIAAYNIADKLVGKRLGGQAEPILDFLAAALGGSL